MPIETLLRTLAGQGITLWVADDRLFYKKASGKLSAEEKEMLTERKSEITAFLIARDNAPEFELTDIQTAYLLGRGASFEYGGVASHVYLELAYDDISLERLKETWARLIKTHEMLRAVVLPSGVQKILNEIPALNVFCSESVEDRINLREKWGHKIYDTTQWPLFDIGVTRDVLGYLLHLSFDFLIADWASVWLLIAEFEKLYYDDIAPAQPLATFRKYLEAEKRKQFGDAYRKDKDYWIERLDSLPEAPMLPVQGQGGRFYRLAEKLGAGVWGRLKSHAKAAGVTPTALVLTAFGYIIEKWSENQSFIINLTMLNRTEAAADIVGDFTSINLLEFDRIAVRSFIEDVRAVNGRLFSDLAHNSFSGVEVLRALRQRRKQPGLIFPIVFTGSIGLVDLSGLRGKITANGVSQTPQVFLDCQVMDIDDCLYVNWDVRSGIFENGIAEDMFGAFIKTLVQISDSINLSGIITPELPEAQIRRRISVNSTDTTQNRKTLQAQFLETLRAYPDKIAVAAEDGVKTYKQLYENGMRIAKLLREKGCGVGDLVAIKLQKSTVQIEAVLGVLFAGAAFVPIDTAQPEQRVKTIIEQNGIRFLIGIREDEILELSDCVIIDNAQLDSFPLKQSELVTGTFDDIAYVIFTSGSTGVPKGVVIQQSAVVNTLIDVNERFSITSGDCVLGLSQLHFDLAVYDIFGIFAAGGTLVLPENKRDKDPSHWAELMDRHSVTVWNTVPALMRMLVEYLELKNIVAPNLTLDKVILSGDWIPTDLPQRITAQFGAPTVIAMGGATEASIWSNYHICTPDDSEKRSIPYGVPLANQQFYILDEHLLPCPDMVRGNLYIAGDGLAAGYLNDPDKTRNQFIVHPETGIRLYKTGDNGRYLPNGEIEFLGRKDDQVKISGYRVELGEIESALKLHNMVMNAKAVVVGDIGEKRIFAAITTVEAQSRRGDILPLSSFNKDVCIAATQDEIDVRDAIAYAAMVKTFQREGFFTKGAAHTTQELFSGMAGMGDYQRVIPYWLKSLADGGILEIAGDAYYYSGACEGFDFEAAFEKMRDHSENNDVFIDYYKTCVECLPEVIAGNISPVELLYPEGDTRVIDAIYKHMDISILINEALSKYAAYLAANSVAEVRVLELGAGSGAAAIAVLDEFAHAGISNYTYTFTDRAASFFPNAKRNLEKYSNVSYALFDIDGDFRAQGVYPNSFDIVIASGVIENARSIKDTLSTVRNLLKPGGRLLMTEPIVNEPWILVSQIFMMTPPEDDLRKEAAYLSETQWIETLMAADGKDNIERLFTNEAGREQYRLNLFCKTFEKGYVWISDGELKTHVKSLLPAYMTPHQIQIVDALPLTANGKVDKKAVGNWYITATKDIPRNLSNHFVARDDVYMALQTLVQESLHIDIIGDDNFYDLGADSLLMAQIAGKVRDMFADDADLTFDIILRQLLNYPTLESLYTFILEKHEPPTATKNEYDAGFGVYHIWGEDNGSPVKVLFHAGIGTLNCFRYFIDAFETVDAGKLIAISVRDAEKYCNVASEQLIETISEDYANRLADMGHNRMQLIGYCLGGLIAVETARRLLERGIDVVDLSIVDSYPVLTTIADELALEAIYLPNYFTTIGAAVGNVSDEDLMQAMIEVYTQNGDSLPERALDELAHMPECQKAHEVFSTLRHMSKANRFNLYSDAIKRITGNDVPAEMLDGAFRIYCQSFNAANMYPQYYSGDIRFFMAKEDTKFMMADKAQTLAYWDNICLGNFSIIEVAGNHITCIEDADNAKTLLEAIAYIDTAT
jgi:pyochelin synthetase